MLGQAFYFQVSRKIFNNSLKCDMVKCVTVLNPHPINTHWGNIYKIRAKDQNISRELFERRVDLGWASNQK